jgi:FkbM family methyltransferase
MLGQVKDLVIASGMESWARPLWMHLTRQKYAPHDAQVFAIIERCLRADSVCIDIGCHKGLILDAMIRSAPNGRFIGFEPLPSLYRLLRRKYRRDQRVTLHDCALYSEPGTATFYVDVKAPALSGLRRRNVKGAEPETQAVAVTLARLDDALAGVAPHFIKIDVEGAELHVLRGARETLARHRPVVVFEHGMGGADFYGDGPEAMFELLAQCGMRVSLLGDFLDGKAALGEASFCRQYYDRSSYYFVAHA